ncbi:MAG TPA: hypothetical protein VL524_19805 [Gemmatimonadaceae bacterium]|nr:hypothetical protein [Gemmatimonadaceae bacterium]
MPFPSARAWCVVLLPAIVVACGGDSTRPVVGPPARLDAVSDLSRSAIVATAVPGGIVVKVADASGHAVTGASVAFAVTVGNGSTNPLIALTDAKGEATATWTLGTVAGTNEVVATVSGVTPQVKFSATGAAGPVTSIAISPQNPRLLVNVDTIRLTARGLDAYGNVAAPPTFAPRDPTLISIDSAGLVHALRRGAGTYVVATAGAKTDSVLVTVLAAGQSICAGAAEPMELSIGQVVTDLAAGAQGFCVHASTSGAEYAVIPYYNASTPNATTRVDVRGFGVAPLPLPSPLVFPARTTRIPVPPIVPNDAFEMQLRARERIEAAARLANPTSWHRPLREVFPSRSVTTSVPNIGDLLQLNASATSFCDNPSYRTGRVAAITDKAIVVADTANPEGGFTDEEYRSIGVTFDTVSDPVDRAAFGAPSDIDNNGRVILFFTRSVNELTSPGASSVTLGFFYSRDLYPKTTAPGPCAGSNQAEMFYLLVPDTGGVVNGNKRSKSLVTTLTDGTVAHEYQHLINASRRMYVNGVGPVFEERWLDEGLAHTAEDLNFYRAAGRTPRANLDFSGFQDPVFTSAYSTYALNNTRRYSQYLGRTESQGPIGFDSFDDDLPTRGAIWSFLRFAADHLPVGTENTFWFNLVNSKTTGIANLTAALGTSPYPLLRDWAISVFADDNAAGLDQRFQQPSWNLRSVITAGGTSIAFPLATRTLVDGAITSVNLTAYGVSFMRFSVASGEDALITASSNGLQLPPTVQLAVMRVR